MRPVESGSGCGLAESSAFRCLAEAGRGETATREEAVDVGKRPPPGGVSLRKGRPFHGNRILRSEFFSQKGTNRGVRESEEASRRWLTPGIRRRSGARNDFRLLTTAAPVVVHR